MIPENLLTQNTQNAQALQILRDLVNAHDATFLGVQVNLPGLADSQLWFRNNKTGRDLHVDINPMGWTGTELHAAVGTLINADTDLYMNRKVSVPVLVLRDLSDNLVKLSEKIDALYEEKKQ